MHFGTECLQMAEFGRIAPIGTAIIGSKIGDEVTVAAPTFEYKVRILDVQRAKSLEQ